MRNPFVTKAEALANDYTHHAWVWFVPCWAKNKREDGSFSALPKFLPLAHYIVFMNWVAKTWLEIWVAMTGNYFLIFRNPIYLGKRIATDDDKVEFL